MNDLQQNRRWLQYLSWHGDNYCHNPETEIAKFILRVKVTAEYSTAVGKMNITCLKLKEGALQSIRYNKLPDFTSKDKTKYVDITMANILVTAARKAFLEWLYADGQSRITPRSFIRILSC